MRNYIILNDINSNTINGLLIQQLPPISKPKMRTRVEEIDGRAGDITTQLGFSAYDKTIEIGLYKDFDIDEVISYFNSSGTVVFSNEPDKYYNYEILDQIDFERLIRFRTAKVKMHVQPFKYPTEEEPLVGQYQYVSDTGSNLSLNNTADALFKKFDLKGNTSQNGTPTPDAPVPVNVVSGDNTITISDGTNSASYPIYLGVENLVNEEVMTSNSNCTITDKVITTSALNSWNSFSVNINNISLEKNTNYYATFKAKLNSGTGALNYGGNLSNGSINGTQERISPTNVLTNEYQEFCWKITTTEDDFVGIRMLFQMGSNTTSAVVSIKDIVFSKKANAPYLPYGKAIELCKIGTYQDYIYKDNGSWYLHKEIGKVVLDGTESGWSYQSNNKRFYRYFSDLKNNGEVNASDTYCNYFTPSDTLNIPYTIVHWSNALFFYSGDMFSSLSEVTTWLGTTKPIVYYILATPTNTLIEDTTLIEQLEALKLATSYEGQTNISHDSNDEPFLVDVSALQSGSDQLVVDNEGNIYSRPTLDLEGTGIVNVYLEGNQMFQVDLTDTNEIVIDTDEMEAYNPTTQALMNRQVTGNYDNFKLNVGDNTLKFSGDLTKATVTNYVRWL